MIYLLSNCSRNLAAKYKKKGALSMERRNAWKVYDQTELEKLDKINETYKNCLDDGKTERECITLAVKKAEAAGYKNLKELQKEHVKLKSRG